jgi:hypothetical protein
MKYVFVFLVLCIFMTGCVGWGSEVEQDMESEIMSDMPIIGWFWRSHNTTTKSTTTTTLFTSTLPPFPEAQKCPEHQYWNQMYNSCMCEADYYLEGTTCKPKSLRECSVDRDCSPSEQLSICSGDYAKRVYYCDLTNYKCAGGKGNGVIVDCRSEYGQSSRCVNGGCT